MSVGKAIGFWAIYVLVFVAFGGIGAGLTALIFEGLLQDAFTDALYAIVFGVTGYMAYRLCQRVLGQR